MVDKKIFSSSLLSHSGRLLSEAGYWVEDVDYCQRLVTGSERYRVEYCQKQGCGAGAAFCPEPEPL